MVNSVLLVPVYRSAAILLGRMSTGDYDDDAEYDVDVFLWYPYSRPEVVVPAGVEYGVEVRLRAVCLRVSLANGESCSCHLFTNVNWTIN